MKTKKKILIMIVESTLHSITIFLTIHHNLLLPFTTSTTIGLLHLLKVTPKMVNPIALRQILPPAITPQSHPPLPISSLIPSPPPR